MGASEIEVYPHFNLRFAPLITISWQCLSNDEKALKNSFPRGVKMPLGDANFAARWCRAGPLSILIFKSWQVCNSYIFPSVKIVCRKGDDIAAADDLVLKLTWEPAVSVLLLLIYNRKKKIKTVVDLRVHALHPRSILCQPAGKLKHLWLTR